MCDTRVDGVGNICRDCQEEFKQSLQNHEEVRTEKELIQELDDFMKTPYLPGSDVKMSVDELFTKYTNY